MGLKIAPELSPLGVCTSSGTVGPSLSSAGPTPPASWRPRRLADAAASGLGNRVQTANDIAAALEWVATVPDLLGAVVIVGDKLGAWGRVELTPLAG